MPRTKVRQLNERIIILSPAQECTCETDENGKLLHVCKEHRREGFKNGDRYICACVRITLTA